MLEIDQLLSRAIEAAELACKPILEVYHSGNFAEEVKKDNSPLTLADKRSHDVIVKLLGSLGIPILSEEGKSIPFAERKDWEYFWMVDPLDGTKEFLKQIGEFTVNIALIQRDKPILGVVAVPVTGEVYYATRAGGAFLMSNGRIRSLPRKAPIDFSDTGLRVVASRSHMDAATQAFVGRLKNPSLVSIGSSLKFMLIADGQADVYPRFAPTMEWDTAAAHAITDEVGAAPCSFGAGMPLSYNKMSLVNPGFWCAPHR
jgi:3'(2'), 5'-bisphosphate nucleotidase